VYQSHARLEGNKEEKFRFLYNQTLGSRGIKKRSSGFCIFCINQTLDPRAMQKRG
jgi:hypothetical protein